MTIQTIVTEKGERLVVMSEADYQNLLEMAEDLQDLEAVHQYEEKRARGEGELIPAAIVERFLSGENALVVWREHRGMSVASLASASGLSDQQIIEIEAAGLHAASSKDIAALATALRLQPQDLI